jgi:hypothetical protein
VPSEADTCRKFVVPLVQAAGWDNDPYSIAEQRTIKMDCGFQRATTSSLTFPSRRFHSMRALLGLGNEFGIESRFKAKKSPEMSRAL